LEYRFVWPKYIHTFIHHNKENFNSYKHTDSESTYAPQIAFVLALSAEYYTVYKCYCNSPRQYTNRSGIYQVLKFLEQFSSIFDVISEAKEKKGNNLDRESSAKRESERGGGAKRAKVESNSKCV